MQLITILQKAVLSMIFFGYYYLVHLSLMFVLNFAFKKKFGSEIMGLDLVSYNNLDSGLAAVGLDLVSFSSIYSEVNS